MTHEQNHNHLRELLAKWYAGTSTRNDEWELALLLSAATSLPDDIEADKRVFLSFEKALSANTPMPEKYSVRIADALENEIAREQSERRDTIFPRKCHRLLIRLAVACSLLLLAGFSWKWFTRDSSSPVAEPSTQTATPAAVAIATPNRVISPESSSEESDKTAAPSIKETSGKQKVSRKSYKSNSQESTLIAKTGVDSPYDYYPDNDDSGKGDEPIELLPEEQALASANYRIVYDTREAEEILEAVLSRLDRNMELEAMRLSKIESQQESEIARIEAINNLNSILDCRENRPKEQTSPPTNLRPASQFNSNPI